MPDTRTPVGEALGRCAFRSEYVARSLVLERSERDEAEADARTLRALADALEEWNAAHDAIPESRDEGEWSDAIQRFDDAIDRLAALLEGGLDDGR